MNINGTFRFHNIGQGLFYSGILNKKEPKSHDVFSFVYDCGTYSALYFLMREIKSFKPLLPSAGTPNKKRLDMLVISHLHDDHVNGLEYLLDGVEVDTVVMPYVDDGLKSLPLVESAGNSDFLRTFYLDPVRWLASRGVRRIMLLGAEDVTPEGKNISLYQPINNDDSDINVDPESVIHIDSVGSTSIIYLKSRSAVSCRNYCWEFKFENLKLDPTVIASYKSIVEDYIRKYRSLADILMDKKLTGDLRAEIKTRCGDIFNRTSVVLLHRPIASDARVQLSLCGYYTPYKYIDNIAFGSVLTGDVELKKGESFDILDATVVKHEYSVVQFPHHGAKNDYNIEYFRKLPVVATVLSYGIANKYGHPHGKVLCLLKKFSLVNERQAFDYQIFIFD
ncbi:MAG: hypothetical protein J1E98_08690 [Lachnospiraceae bacterium]|nr:hypothetical protein [Lachnospiraceae bacterium]